MSEQENTQHQPIRLKDAKWSELGQVPIFELLEAFDRIAMMVLSAVFVAIGTGSFAVGLGTLFALRFIGSKIEQGNRERE